MISSVGRQCNAMTVDVEDYFQVQAFAKYIDRTKWTDFPSHVEANTRQLLELFARSGIRATFFTLGWVADRLPGLVREIVSGGHELASHGYGHQLVHELTPMEFRDDVLRAKQVLEDAGGVAVRGYRAPTFSIGPRNAWAFDVLADTGHQYSSSVYPVKHDLYGAPGSPRLPYQPTARVFLELPMTTLRIGKKFLPISGGGYFRLVPYWLYRRALSRFNDLERRPGIFYIHPWEIDIGQPRIRQAGSLAKFRHYLNIRRVPDRMLHLLHDFNWGRIDEVFATELAAVRG